MGLQLQVVVPSLKMRSCAAAYLCHSLFCFGDELLTFMGSWAIESCAVGSSSFVTLGSCGLRDYGGSRVAVFTARRHLPYAMVWLVWCRCLLLASCAFCIPGHTKRIATLVNSQTVFPVMAGPVMSHPLLESSGLQAPLHRPVVGVPTCGLATVAMSMGYTQ